MGYLPSSLPHLSDLKLLIQGSLMLHLPPSPPDHDNVLTIPVARDPLVEKSVTEQTKEIFGPLDNVLTVVSNIVRNSE